jgi:predicted acyl esterase
MSPEGQDRYDTIETVAAESWCDGNIGMAGGSYPARVQNLNTGNPFGQDAEGTPVIQTIYHQADFASHIDLPVIPPGR